MDRKWNIWDQMQRMQEEMDRVFEGFTGFGPFGIYRSREALPSHTESDIVCSNYKRPLADMWETDKDVLATLEIPGVTKEDIDINVVGDSLEITVEKKEELKEEDKKQGMYRLERRYGGYYRNISLPENVDPDKIKATYANGVLELRMPKVKSRKKGRSIKVN